MVIPMIDEPDPLTEMISWSDADWLSLREALGVELSVERIRDILKFAERCGGLESALEALEQAAIERETTDRHAA
jgi:hypothetical protein